MIFRAFSNISDAVILKPLNEVTSSSLHFQHHPTLMLSKPGWGLHGGPNQTLTQMSSGAELVQGSFSPRELLIPQAEIESLHPGIKGAGGRGHVWVQKIPTSTERRGWFFTETIRQQGETKGRTSPGCLIHPPAPCCRKGWGLGEESLSVSLTNFLCQLKGPLSCWQAEPREGCLSAGSSASPRGWCPAQWQGQVALWEILCY